MKTNNLGTADRIIRLLVAVAIAALFFSKVISGPVAVILMIVGGVLLVTSLIGFCPLYHSLKIKTNRN